MPEPNLVLENSPLAAMTREQRLIASVQQGRREVFYELGRPYERRVYAAALALLRNEADVEEVCQEAWRKALCCVTCWLRAGSAVGLAGCLSRREASHGSELRSGLARNLELSRR